MFRWALGYIAFTVVIRFVILFAVAGVLYAIWYHEQQLTAAYETFEAECSEFGGVPVRVNKFTYLCLQGGAVMEIERNGL